MNPITTMDPELRDRLYRVKACVADKTTEQCDLLQDVDRLLAYFDVIESQRARELTCTETERCRVAAEVTRGVYYCKRPAGHDGPCAAEPAPTAG
jgi:hypothetical protein